jgi:hypothetical protein
MKKKGEESMANGKKEFEKKRFGSEPVKSPPHENP